MSIEQRKVLLLEAQLDKDISSLRSQKEFMRLLGTAYESEKVTVVAKEVHSLLDLRYFLDLARGDRGFVLIHFVGHGEFTPGRTIVELTNGDEIDLSSRQGLSVFRDLQNKVILLSCCGIGKDQKTLDKLREVSAALAVFAYAVNVYDYQAFLVDAIMYHLLLGHVPVSEKRMDLESIGYRVQNAIEELLLYRRGRGGGKQVLAWSVQLV